MKRGRPESQVTEFICKICQKDCPNGKSLAQHTYQVHSRKNKASSTIDDSIKKLIQTEVEKMTSDLRQTVESQTDEIKHLKTSLECERKYRIDL